MPGELALPSLEIHNFRGLKELKISRLGRANLIVGKNGVGKTSVLEALRLYTNPALSQPILATLLSRGEISLKSFWGPEVFGTLEFGSLFFDPQDSSTDSPIIRIGPSNDYHRTLSISSEWGCVLPDPNAWSRKYSLRELGARREPGDQRCLVFRISNEILAVPHKQLHNELDSSFHPVINWRAYLGDLYKNSVFLASGGLDSITVARFWDKIALTPLEDLAVQSLRIMVPKIDRVVLKSLSDQDLDRAPFVRLQNSSRPTPLRSFGEGVNRVFELVLLMVNVQKGIFLIDEIENGLHYSILADIWRLIFQIAADFNIQVFATTHSSDCVKAFQEASAESEEEGVLIRLARKDDRILVAEFDERLLEIAVEGQVEVR